MQDIISILVGAVLSAQAYSIDVNQLDLDEVRCLADNIYFEGRNESAAGQMAIALVTMNRVESSAYPNTICEVVKQGPRYKNNPDLPVRWRCQFSWFCDGRSDKIPLTYSKGKRKGQVRQRVYEVYAETVKHAVLVMAGITIDFTEGSTHYYAHNIVTPTWSTSEKMQKVTVIDNHTFMRAVVMNDAPGAKTP